MIDVDMSSNIDVQYKLKQAPIGESPLSTNILSPSNNLKSSLLKCFCK